MFRQLSLFEPSSSLAGIMPALRAAMNRAAGADNEGRKLLVDRINAIALESGTRLTAGNARVVSKDTLDKWLSPGDKDHPPSLLAVITFCMATENFEPLRVVLRMAGLDVISVDERKFLELERVCVEKEKLRARERKIREEIK